MLPTRLLKEIDGILYLIFFIVKRKIWQGIDGIWLARRIHYGSNGVMFICSEINACRLVLESEYILDLA